MEIIIAIMRWLVVLCFVAVGGYLWLAAYLGRRCAYYEIDPFGYCLTQHNRVAKNTFYLTLVAVAITEIFVRLNGGSTAHLILFIHLGFAAPFLCALAYTAFRHTGLKRPRTHKYFAYTCVLLYIGTLISGLTLLFPEEAAVVRFFIETSWW